MRIKIILVVLSGCLALIAADLVYMQVICGRSYYNQSVNNRIRVVPMEGSRGRILDRNGEVLAGNRLAFNVAVIPQDIKDSERLFDFLSRTLGEDKKHLLQVFSQQRQAPFAPVIIAEDVDKAKAMILEESKFLYPGLYIQEDYRRQYPFKEVGAQVLGYVGKINRAKIERLKDYGYSYLSIVGYSGIEEYYDEYLKGEKGGLQVEVNNRGQQVSLLSIREPESGQDVQLTIDARVQTIASEVLGDKKGVIVVMDYDSGEILGMVSHPSYDPNIFVDSRLQRLVHQLVLDPDSPMLNRAIKGQYPPGSLFKTIVAVAALSMNKINPGTRFNCPGFYQLGQRRFHCAHVHGSQDLIQGIAHSCNVYFFNTGMILGPDVLSKYARMFGLGEPTAIDLPFEEKGAVPSPLQRKLQRKEGWYKGDTLNYSIGQGDLLVTPVQIVRLVTTIGRKGQVVQPHMIQKIGEQEMVKLATVKNLRIRPEIFDTVLTGMRGAVTDAHGTARLLNLKGFEIYGKTGTAQSAAGRDDHAWFAGFNKTGQVRVAFCVFLEYGGSSYNAVVLTRDLLTRMAEAGII